MISDTVHCSFKPTSTSTQPPSCPPQSLSPSSCPNQRHDLHGTLSVLTNQHYETNFLNLAQRNCRSFNSPIPLRNGSETTRSDILSSTHHDQASVLWPSYTQSKCQCDWNRPVYPATVSLVDAAADYAPGCFHGLLGRDSGGAVFVLCFGREFCEFPIAVFI